MGSSLGSPNGITVLSTQQVPNKDVLKGDFSSCQFQEVPVADNTISAVGTLSTQPCLGATATPEAPALGASTEHASLLNR